MTSYPSPVPEHLLPKLASDLVIEFRTAAEVLADYGLGLPGQDPRTDALMDNSAFREIFESIQREWQGVRGTSQRIRLKSALLVEDCLPDILDMIKATDGDWKLRLEAFRQLAKMSGVEDEARRSDASPDKFVVNISIGGQQVASVSSGALIDGTTSEEIELDDEDDAPVLAKTGAGLDPAPAINLQVYDGNI